MGVIKTQTRNQRKLLPSVGRPTERHASPARQVIEWKPRNFGHDAVDRLAEFQAAARQLGCPQPIPVEGGRSLHSDGPSSGADRRTFDEHDLLAIADSG